jgi:hypothetical protein
MIKALDRVQLASRVFYVAGLFFFSMSLGWGWGAMTQTRSPLMIGAFFGIGLLGMFIGFFVQMRFAHLLQKQAREVAAYRPISLDDSFKAFRNYREQAPVFSIADLYTQVFAIDSKKELEIPESATWILVELWDGERLNVEVGDCHKRLNEREVALIPRMQPEDKFLTLAMGSDSDSDYCQGIVHFISGQSSLE